MASGKRTRRGHAIRRWGHTCTNSHLLPPSPGEPLGEPDWILGLSDNQGGVGRGFVRTRRQFPLNLCPNNTSLAAPIRGHATELHTSHSLAARNEEGGRRQCSGQEGNARSVRPRSYRIVFVSDRTDGPAAGRSLCLTNRPLIFAPTFQLLHF